MSFIPKRDARVFIYSESIDMRSGFCKLQALIAEKMGGSFFEGHLFLFLGKNPRRAKVIFFDGSGVVLTIKRLDRGSFMKVSDLFETREITLEELERLLDGVNLRVVFAASQAKRNSMEVA